MTRYLLFPSYNESLITIRITAVYKILHSGAYEHIYSYYHKTTRRHRKYLLVRLGKFSVHACFLLVTRSHRDRADANGNTGLGQAWLLRAQQTLARIHRLEGSSSSGASSGQRSAVGVGRAQSFTSSEDAREAARQNVEADARAGGPDYVEARGMLLPATEHLQRAIMAAERTQRVNGDVLALVSPLVSCYRMATIVTCGPTLGHTTDGYVRSQAAEAYISLGNVSYSHHNEQYFQQAIRYLQQARTIPSYQLSPYLQRYVIDLKCSLHFSCCPGSVALWLTVWCSSYLDDFGRLVS